MQILIILIIITCIILGFVVLIQDSKGGGLASNFAGSNQVMGVRKTTEMIEKVTWGLAIAILVLCLSCAFITKKEFSDRYSNGAAQTEQTAEEE